MSNFRIHLGDCLEVMPTMPADSFHSIVTDPPYGLEFMGKHWDHGVPGVDFWKEALRVARPGAHLLAFGGTRTHHRLMVAIEDAEWILRDVLSWNYGSGFPKSLNIGQESGLAEWEGWGTGLKPAWEPIIMAMKPMPGTFVQNAINFGVAGINIDASRIPGDDLDTLARNNKPGGNGVFNASGGPNSAALHGDPLGRWPANVLFDEEAAAVLESQKEGAARFFYVAKASKADRDDGLDEYEERLAKSKFNLNNGSGDLRFDGAPTPTRKNIHPTVKPTALMEYLCRMVTPAGGRILDPFLGSGSTGRGAMLGGFLFEGIEREAEYVEISKRRIAAIKPQAIQGRFI